MKNAIMGLTLLISLSAQAGILSSTYEINHVNAIEAKITEKCGSFRDLKVVSSSEEVIVVDQGIRDVKYTTVLSGLQRMDQNIFDEYQIVVESEYADMYDHVNQTWGAYFVNSVTCQMK